MNWKWIATGILGIAIGISFGPFVHKAVSASETPGNGRFEIQATTVDEANGQGQDVPTHEVFLLDANSGKVWKFQGLVWAQDKDGSAKMFSQPRFVPIPVDAGK